jgi:hypothetical protein
MAQIASQTITISISKLVKDHEALDIVMTSEQLLALVETLPGVVEQLLEDNKLVIEVVI